MFCILFLVACASVENSNTGEIDGNLSASDIVENGMEEAAKAGACASEWVCINSDTKIFRLQNCSFAQRQDCKFGCANNTCKLAPVCSPGFTCHGTYSKGYQQSDCSWISETKCEYGCKDAKCLGKPNETIVAVSTSTPAPVAASWPYLSVGEKVEVSTNNTVYNMSIYILDPDRVQMKLGEKKSDWLSEGESYHFFYGVTITIKEILFQSHEGGIRKVGYELE